MKKSSEKAYIKDLERLDFSKLDNSISEMKDISYMNDNSIEHKLDIYYKNDKKLKPIIVDIHGGGFISSYKEMDSLFANYLAQEGFVVFNLNYRLAYPKYSVFEQIEDIARAVKWIVLNAEEYKGNINEMYIVGHSAGGVLAIAEALLCNDEQMRNDYNIEDRNYNYKGIILDCGAMHFYQKNIAYWGMRNMVFPKGYKKMKKYHYLIFENNNKMCSLPKTVILTNENDELRKMSYYIKQVLDDKKVNNKLYDIGFDGHMGIIFKPYTEDNKKMIREIIKYLQIPLQRHANSANGGMVNCGSVETIDDLVMKSLEKRRV